MDVIKINRPKTLGNYIASEYSSDICRDTATLLAGSGSDRVLPAFTVLGQVTTGALAAAATAFTAGNTGNGTSNAASLLAKATPGDYTGTFVSATKFELEDSEGRVVGTGTVGAAFTKQLGFTLTAGGTPWAAGDSFVITVSAGLASDKYVQLDFTASDGTQTAAAVLLFAATAPNGVDNDSITVLARGPVLANANELIWPAGATAAQIAAGLRTLKGKGIVHRVAG